MSIKSKGEIELSDTLFENIVKTLLIQGELAIEDFENKKTLYKKVLKLNEKVNYKVVIDHKTDIIETAREFLAKKKYNFARLLYATYFEHEINDLILELSQIKGLDKKTINEIIKSVNIIGKYSWLIIVLGAPKFSENHKKIIQKVSEERNAFVHYKYNPLDESSEKINDLKNNNLHLMRNLKKLNQL
nr:hypothetical protein [uncultured Flavobacterium sp.]